jgi:hypothetical protein
MKLKICVLVSICIIFFIRILHKESTLTFNRNLEMLFEIQINKMVIYVYQVLSVVFITSVKRINIILLITLLLINISLIVCYLVVF